MPVSIEGRGPCSHRVKLILSRLDGQTSASPPRSRGPYRFLVRHHGRRGGTHNTLQTKQRSSVSARCQCFFFGMFFLGKNHLHARLRTFSFSPAASLLRCSVPAGSQGHTSFSQPRSQVPCLRLRPPIWLRRVVLSSAPMAHGVPQAGTSFGGRAPRSTLWLCANVSPALTAATLLRLPAPMRRPSSFDLLCRGGLSSTGALGTHGRRGLHAVSASCGRPLPRPRLSHAPSGSCRGP